ncbi:AI-2E family transporter [Wenxinia marina]|uniref:Putative permease n=1 Tax=Wenxinia marina DSM 24838 TaxID=1123501 RepID=A0A0D0QB69_9RHOB|nr:AI-2E family transporter [Wenxinia marina]KIQ69532.1 putative permease [Wenxinia marina DSM 24838]GGL59141.1 AI-2E family transporter [Wenxinia marina]
MDDRRLQRPDTAVPLSPPGPAAPEPARLAAGALIVIAFAVVLFLLVQARFLLISLAVAIILFSLTSDAISFIARQRVGPLRIPNWLASLAAVAFLAALILSLTSIIIAQINTVLVTTLAYLEQAPQAVAGMVRWLGDDAEAAVLNSLQTIEIGGYIRTIAGSASDLMQGSVLVILFVGFLFAERVWFNAKLMNFVGDPAQADRVGRIIGSIIHRVNRYLLVKTGVSLVTGAMVYGVARAFGLELAMALGILTFILNYLPNIGSIVATVLIALVAHVQLGSAGTTASIFVICTLIQFVNGSIIDPMLMGRALRLSPFVIIFALAFWGAVWGVPGMFLSVPIMVAIMIVCSEIPALRGVAILLSREGLPEPETRPDPGLLARQEAAE